MGVAHSPRLFDLSLVATKAAMCVCTTMLTRHVVLASVLLMLLATWMAVLVRTHKVMN